MASPDPRFARLHTDPRFRRPKQKNLKVEIDERFRDVLESEEFGGKSKGKGKGVDKRGRPLTGSHHADQLKRFYRLRSASPEPEGEFVDYARGEGVLESSGSESEDESSEEEEELEIGTTRRNRLPHLDIEESESEESHLEVDLSDEEALDLDEDDAELDEEDEEEEYAEPTTRVAAVNLDWDNLRAADLFSVFNSFLLPSAGPSSSSSSNLGKLLNVRIYPSDFGKERMEREEREGPSARIFGRKDMAVGGEDESDEDEDEDEDDLDDEELDEGSQQDDDQVGDGDSSLDDPSEDEEDEEESRPTRGRGKGPSRPMEPKEIDGLEIVSDVSDDEDGDVNMDQLRQYQLERLRYYYAIATFSTVQAAMKIVEECNGTEFERTANVLDLSYVPEGMEFSEDDIKDEATKELKGYKGNDFITDALRHSKVKLTWDQDDPNRTKVTRRNLTKEEMEEEDFKAYVGSGSESEGDDQAAASGSKGKQNKDALRGLLLNGEDETGDVWGKAAWSNDRDTAAPRGDMEITFKSALSGKPKDTEEMTTLEKYQMRVKEKKARKKEKVELKRVAKEGKDGVDDAGVKATAGADDFFGSDSEDDLPESEVKTKRSNRPPEPVVEDDTLEGLEEVAGGTHVEHFSMKDILRAEKDTGKVKKRKRSKKKNAERDVELGKEGWKIDTSDPRFKALHEEPDFAIDPSNPRFQKTKAMQELLDERNKRKKDRPAVPTNGGKVQPSKGSGELGSLVQSVKSKMGQNRGRKRTKR